MTISPFDAVPVRTIFQAATHVQGVGGSYQGASYQEALWVRNRRPGHGRVQLCQNRFHIESMLASGISE
jgi:hypothetical protein